MNYKKVIRMKFNFFLLFGLVLIFICGISSIAQAVTTDSDVAISSNYIYDQKSTSNSRAFQDWQDNMGQGPVRKFGRGICNVLFGVFEIPIQVYDTNQTTGGFAAWTYGLCKGVGRFVLRELVGVTEVVTFFMPLPGCSTQKYGSGWGYGPIMEPEWIFSFETDPYNTVYPNKAPM